MKLLVYGCERHIVRFLQRRMGAVDVPTDGDLEAALQEHQPTHLVADTEELAAKARLAVNKLGLSTEVCSFGQPFTDWP